MGPYMSQTGPEKNFKLKSFYALLLVAALMGCLLTGRANAQSVEKDLPQNPRQANLKDPWESFNRSMFRLNDQIDQSVTRPLAQTYVDVTPSLVRKGVRNFFGNISDFWSSANSALQFKPVEAAHSLARVLINTTIGVYGLIDWATPMRFERHTEDFGQTLGVWGVPSGPYLVLPLLGPSTLRDSSALLALDVKATPIQRVRPSENKYELTALNLTDKRAKYLGMEQELEEAALDRYSFVRDVYLQKRRSDIYDGEPPTEKEEDFSQ